MVIKLYRLLQEFTKRHNYLICVDSDGCAMDTMDCKHIYSFGPRMVEEWGLETWRDMILERWNIINLYSMTRGINRFKGLNMMLTEVNENYTTIAGLSDLAKWVNSGAAPGNDALKQAIHETGSAILKKALSWSEAVNASIAALPEELKKPFPGAKDGLAAASEFADVAIVSSANRDAVVDEWTKFGLLNHVDVILAQDMGSKAHCIAEMLKFGYDRDKVLMVGDAPGDRDAALANGVHYYPILVRHEGESWTELKEIGFSKLKSGEYGGYETQKMIQFIANLGG